MSLAFSTAYLLSPFKNNTHNKHKKPAVHRTAGNSAKLFKEYDDIYRIPRREDILKDEYSSIEELLKNTYPNRWKTVVENSKEEIKEAEKIAKTKFFCAKDTDPFFANKK